MCGGGEAGENALLGKEKRAGADGQEGTLVGGVLLLQLDEGGNEGERFGISLDDLVAVAADDDEDVKLAEALVGLLEGDLGANGDARVGNNLGLSGRDGTLEGLGVCGVRGWSAKLCHAFGCGGKNKKRRLTLVALVVKSVGQGLHWACHVKEVEVRLQGEQNLDRLVRHCRALVCHLDDRVWNGIWETGVR